MCIENESVIETSLIMMAALVKILKISIFLLTFFSKCFANECYQEGKTWVKENQLLVVENADLRQCAAAYLACHRDYWFSFFSCFFVLLGFFRVEILNFAVWLLKHLAMEFFSKSVFWRDFKKWYNITCEFLIFYFA